MRGQHTVRALSSPYDSYPHAVNLREAGHAPGRGHVAVVRGQAFLQGLGRLVLQLPVQLLQVG